MDTFISFDVETTGGIPGVNSILSLGAVAFNKFGDEVSSFYRKLKDPNGYERNENTMLWWDSHPREFSEAIANSEDPEFVMNDFFGWILSQWGKVELGAFPVAHDSGMLFHYLGVFVGDMAVKWIEKQRFRAIDIRGYLANALGVDYSEANRSCIPVEWMKGLSITHRADEDARVQGHVFFAARNEIELLHQLVSGKLTTNSV